MRELIQINDHACLTSFRKRLDKSMIETPMAESLMLFFNIYRNGDKYHPLNCRLLLYESMIGAYRYFGKHD